MYSYTQRFTNYFISRVKTTSCPIFIPQYQKVMKTYNSDINDNNENRLADPGEFSNFVHNWQIFNFCGF